MSDDHRDQALARVTSAQEALLAAVVAEGDEDTAKGEFTAAVKDALDAGWSLAEIAGAEAEGTRRGRDEHSARLLKTAVKAREKLQADERALAVAVSRALRVIPAGRLAKTLGIGNRTVTRLAAQAGRDDQSAPHADGSDEVVAPTSHEHYGEGHGEGHHHHD